MRSHRFFVAAPFLLAACTSGTTASDPSTDTGAGGTGGTQGAAGTGAGGAVAGKGGSVAGVGGAGPGVGGAGAGPGAGGAAGAGGAPECKQCASTPDCAANEACSQLPQAQDAFCLPTCSTMNCSKGAACIPVSTSEGDQVDACVPVTQCGATSAGQGGSGAAGASSTGKGGSGPAQGGGPGQGGGTGKGGSPGAGGTGSTEICGSVVGPDVMAPCTSCSKLGKPCQTNGCYGGWWCNGQTMKCQAPPNPASCGTGPTGQGGSATGQGGTGVGQGGSGVGQGGSGPASGIGPDGGTVTTLRFAIVGDTRPPVNNDTKGYPVAVISQIWADVEAHNPRPDFAVTTGDYMFASPSSGQAAPQLDLYLKARSSFKNLTFPAFGNHECTGATTSNCGPQGKDGLTDNYNQFISKMLAPVGKTVPYYSINVNGTSGWSAKFVFVAANAWDSAQATWLDQALSQSTTYTFVIRHESDSVSGVTGVTASKQIIDAHPLTHKLVGHAHTYQRVPSAKEVIIGNGGAPLAGSVNYGYVIAEQRSDGAIVFSAYDYATNAVIDTWAVDKNGNPA